MDVDSGALSALALGMLLGLKHATDADHVVAVSTIVSEYRNAWRGLWVGGSWGLGHTTPLLALGVLILLFQDLVMRPYESIAPWFELGVGAMLVFLGAQVFWNLKLGRLHVHAHESEESPHVHIHATHGPGAGPDAETRHGFFHFGRPFFRFKSYTVGVAHGLAGSAAVMLVLLPTLPNVWTGIGYLLMFGVGTVVSMSAITLLLGVPFALSGGAQRLNRMVAGVAGAVSVALGAALMADMSLGTTLVPF